MTTRRIVAAGRVAAIRVRDAALTARGTAIRWVEARQGKQARA